MHVGIFLDDKVPSDGGGYTFIHDVVTSVVELAGSSDHRFTLFCPAEYAQTVAQNAPLNFETSVVGKQNFIALILRELRHASPAFGILWSGTSRLERLAVSRGVELMWFVGGAYDTLNIPYFTTVWDIQHRTHPWFPEVSAKGVWEHREAFFARHLGRAARIITGTEVGKKEIARFYGIGEERIEILPHPTPRFALTAARGGVAVANLEPGYFYYPAQFWPHKNHANLLLGYRLFCDTVDKPPKLVLTGSPKNNYAFIQALVGKLNLEKQVEFLGFLPTGQMAAVYSNAGAMVYASFSGPENLPPLEAFALGCPVVTSDFPGAREQLGDAALFFDPHKPAEIAEAMRRIASDAGLRRDLIERGTARAKKWTSADFVRGVFDAVDAFEPERRAWGQI